MGGLVGMFGVERVAVKVFIFLFPFLFPSNFGVFSFICVF